MLRPRFRSRSDGEPPSGGMDLGTRALVLGVGALAVSWVPVFNILAFLAALMAVSFGLLARWPTGWIANEDPNTRRALWGIGLGVVAIIVFVITAIRYSAI